MIDYIKKFLKRDKTTPVCPHCDANMENRYKADTDKSGYRRWDCRTCPRLWDCDSFIFFENIETGEIIRHIKCLPKFKLISTFIKFPKGSNCYYIPAGETEVYLHRTGMPPDYIIPKTYRLDDPKTLDDIAKEVSTFLVFS